MTTNLTTIWELRDKWYRVTDIRDDKAEEKLKELKKNKPEANYKISFKKPSKNSK